MGLGCFGPWNAQATASPPSLTACLPRSGECAAAQAVADSVAKAAGPLALAVAGRFFNPVPVALAAVGSRADHVGPVPLVRIGVWPQRCLSRGEATVPSRRGSAAMATEAIVPAAVTGKVGACDPANLAQAVRDAVWRPVCPGVG
jgi:hypothetical protein